MTWAEETSTVQSHAANDPALAGWNLTSVVVGVRPRPAPGSVDLRACPSNDPLDGKTAHFTDGTTREVDAIVLCTGYLHNLSFIEESLRLRTTNVLYTPDLYKGVFWLDNPNLMYLSMQDQYYTFTLFDAEAWYARDYVLGRIELPSRAEMADDIALWRDRQDKLSSAFEEIDFQADHMVDLLKDVDYPTFDVDLTRAHFKEVGARRRRASSATATAASPHRARRARRRSTTHPGGPNWTTRWPGSWVAEPG